MVSQSPAASATSQRTSSAKNTQPNPFGYTGPGPNTANSSTTSSPIDTTSHGSIMICRNKHYPYIASYHGPWLSLPIELLQSLFTLNSEAAATSVLTGTTATPSPPIDPAIFANLIAIRRLVDEASELVIRAAGGGGLSSGGPSGLAGPGSGLWGGDGLGGNGPGSKLSAIRQQRLRELAVSKLARAYRIDEIATAVLTMQSASTMDDIAAKVLKRSPNHADAMYVHFFHEKIPSRMLAASTTSEQLDTIVQQFPGTPEYYRTRAMIRCFREEYPAGLRDFKMAIQLTKKHKRYVNGVECEGVVHGGVRSKLASVVSDGSSEALNGHAKEATNGKPHRRDGKNGSTAPPNLAIFENENCGNESQLYFLRGACFHQYAVSLIDRAIQRVNEARKRKRKTIRQLRRFLSERSEVATMTPITAYNPPDIAPAQMDQYAEALKPLVGQILILARRSIKDYVHFLSFYPTNLEPFDHLLDRTAALYNNPNSLSTILNTLLTPPTEAECKTPLPLGSYHPLLVETWYAIGINYLILGDWRTAAMWHHRVTEQLMDNVEGYPVFLPARSMSQADYAEILRFLRRLFVKEQVGSAIAKRASTGSTLGNGKVGDGGKNGNSIAGPASTGGSASGSTGYNKLLKQYPLHTKRADTLLVWLQSTVVPGGGLAGLEKLATATYGKGDVETELPRANKRK
ncbi:hypothetical protein BJ742DRAFT_704383 [Cladochytrium replicatum]|nr:hypothetical protein BJ742DRAFT_704383 [Cladochytrium replicatum]